MRTWDSIIDEYRKELKRLVESRLYSFSMLDRTEIPASKGVYGVFDKEGELLYIGESKNLKRRLFNDHLNGDRQASAFRRNLSEHYHLEKEADITQYILDNCFFRYVEIDEQKLFEHFAISILKPRLNR